MIYETRYKKLIQYYKSNPPEGFVERHHILPKCMGGDDSIDNIVILPARVHFIAHYLLHKAYPENRNLAHAFAMMGVSNKFQRRSSRLYEKSKIARSKAMLGIARPEWVKEKLRKPKSTIENYKKPKTKSHAQNISNSLKGKSKSKEAIENSVKAKQGYFKKLREEKDKRQNYYRNLFIESNLTRKDFYERHNEISLSTLKKYLVGL